ncbi:KH domain-containing protein akap-1 isoform X1 [Frankliniella occidentalis]|uniref:KH domain-containing protein akap-1 isoform X1 n=1 Tax=Frankliniella occidentalis TaxID=133901 RepID=A0A6J1S3C3_FRAOC|nr:KH domain-containing protein akap-1 isoform X1 [Frankliniella occidentalis]XP_026275713.1 KH domain-containing protein akap-1 isoform X1 [Frankliniella occidentalis]XP_026275714.1 KH domain-containing protein akap-1 isoform X1 [Frankliniella occidentalis]
MSRMAPASTPRQLWVWSLPSLVILLSLVWYKRKRNTLRSDPGGTSKLLPDASESESKGLEEDNTSPLLVHGEATSNPDSTNESVELYQKSLASVKNLISEKPGGIVEVPISETDSVKPESTEVLAVEEVLCKQVAPVCDVLPVRKEAKVCEVIVDKKEIAPCVTENSKEKSTESEDSVIVCEKKVITTSTNMKDTKEVEVSVAPSKDLKDDSDKVAALEGKLASLALGSSEEQRRGAERDSANHSPVDAMLASPSMSSYSDEHSEGSSDSGKGCSDVASPPSRTPVGSGSLAGDAEVGTGVESTSGYTVYDFLLSQLYAGRLIGRHGCFVKEIKAKTNASIWIKRHPKSRDLKICSVEGTSAEIENALAMIRQQFPLNKYPTVTLEQISSAPTPSTFPLVPDFCQLHLVEGVNNEVMISSLVSPAHMFIQQPYHPSYQFLQRLNHMMNSVYAHVETPNLPEPIEAGNICVAPAVDGWYRAQVVSTNEESQTSEIKFVDYGGYMAVNNTVLRQIRQDFMTLPFQATECYLANIKPSGESGEWGLEALRIVEELTRGQMLLAQVYDYAADGVPLIYLYSSVNSQPWMYDPEVVLINQELVARGMADVDDSVSSSSEAGSLVVAAKAVAAVAAAAASEASSNSQTEETTESSTTKECEDKSTTVEPSTVSEVAAN